MATVTGTASFTIAALTLAASGTSAASSTYRLACVVGGVALTGQAATTWYQPATTGAGGQITIDVSAAAAGACSLIVTCGAASQSIPLTVSSGYTLGADVRSYSLSGVAASVAQHRLMAMAAGSFTETGVAALSRQTYRYTVGPAQTFALGSTSTALVKVGGYALPTDSSTGTLSGPATGLLATRAMAGAQSSLALTGVSTPIGAQRLVTATVSTIDATRPAVTLIRSARLIAATADGYTVFASQAGQTFTRRLTAESSARTLSGQEVTLTEGVSGSTVMPALTAEFEANGVDVTLGTPQTSLATAILRRRRGVANAWGRK
jgi:hypothetical protein